MLTDTQRAAAAAALRTAELDRVPISPLTATYDRLTVDDAYEIQLINIRHRIAGGAMVRGHKVGLSSKAMQEMMGVTEPDYGHLLAEMFIFEHDSVPVSRYLQPRIEVETAFVLDRALPAPGCTAADVLRCTAFICPAIELIDSRIADWKITLGDTIADNASSAGVILGGSATRIHEIDPRSIDVRLSINGEQVATGRSDAVLGNPVTAVAWLANKVHGFGVRLEAGHVILPGSCTRAFDVKPGDSVKAEFERLGPVSVSFT